MDRPAADDLTVLRRLLPVAGRRMLDVGCGGGGLVRRLAAAGADALGLETSQDRIAVARAADPDGAARYVAGRAEALPFADASIDAIVFMRSLHHVPVALMDRALAEAARVLPEDGAVYVAEPLAEGTLFALVKLVDDETEVRARAQDAIARAAAAGLVPGETAEYETRPSFPAFPAFRDHLVGVDPARAGAVAAQADALERAFDRLAARDPKTGTATFSAPMRAQLLYRAGRSDG